MASADRNTLLVLFRSTGGLSWRLHENWDKEVELSQWHGVDTNDEGRVVALSLAANSLLRGFIPPSLGNLAALETLHLYNNALSGPIPPELKNLAALKRLSLWRNQLSGWIPKELGAFAELTYLSLGGNQLTGEIPKELGALSKLQTLWLNHNRLTGHIPEELGDLRNLETLWLHFNRLSGNIPKELGALSKLQTLGLNQNRLTGPIPQELGNLTVLKHLHLWENQLGGTIPKELAALDKLETLDLRSNQLKALWDHTQDVRDVGYEEGVLSATGRPTQLQRLLDLFSRVQDGKRMLDFGGNPWVEPPESIVRQPLDTIKRYFEDLYTEPCRVQRNSVKIILVGQEGAGKTSLRQSMKANRAAPTDAWKEESTVFADVETMEIAGASVRVYDCAGQVAYTGLLQMFLTPRSVCALVCDAEAFGQPGGRIGCQVQQDCRKLEELRVCDWLRSISRRVPENDAILVATKCDLAGGRSREIGTRMEHACRTWLASWTGGGMQPMRLEGGVSLTSCCIPRDYKQGEGRTTVRAAEGGWACDWRDSSEEASSPSLLQRLINKSDGSGFRGAQMVLPRSWDIALTVLEAIECGRDPVEKVLLKLANLAGGKATGAKEVKTGVYHGITSEELRAKWQETVRELHIRGITVTNAENALEGALSIREFDGSLIRYGNYVFLDVVWLARILKPLLNHKDEETFDGFVHLGETGDTRITLCDPSDIASWRRLKSEGILEPRLAHAMWPAGLSEYVLPTLQFLGLTFPLESDRSGGLVVLLRLKPDRPERVGKVLDTFCSRNTPALSARWKIFLGMPAGAIEKVLARCSSLGDVRTFWRSGVLVHGSLGGRAGNEIFAVILEYSSEVNELTVLVYGDISTPAPWAALSYVISAVRCMFSEFPGLRSKGTLDCPQHGDTMLLANEGTRAGDQLLMENAGCSQCSLETMGQGAAAVELLRMVDIQLDRGVLFDEVETRFADLDGGYFLPCLAGCVPQAISKDENVLIETLNDMAISLKGGLDEIKGGMEGGVGEMKRGLTEVKEGLGDVKGGLGEVKNEVTAAFGVAKEGLNKVDRELDQLKGGMKEGFDEVKGALDNVTASTQESLVRLRNLQGRDYLYPRLVTIKEVEPGGAASETKGRKGLTRKRRLTSIYTRLRWVGRKQMTLHFLCPTDMSEVPCGEDGEGYRFHETRDWVKKLVPVLQVAVVTAKVALKATTGLEVQGSDFLNAVKDGVFEELVDGALDEDALLRVASGEEDVGTDAQRNARVSFAFLKTFMDKEKLGRRKGGKEGDGYVDFRDRMQRVTDGKGGMVWVKNENVPKWLDSISAPAPSR
ncbi:unnamed protein product [Scytosiphon promiscuus]